MKRPLAMLALLYAGGVLLAEHLPLPLGLLWMLTLILAGAALLVARARLFLLMLLLVALGALNLTRQTAVISPDDLRLLLADNQPADITVRGRLVETPSLRIFVRDEEESHRTLAWVEVEALRHQAGWQRAEGRVLALTPSELSSEYCQGQRVEVAGIVSLPPIARAPGLFDYRAHLRRQGVHFQLRVATSNDWRVASTVPAPPPMSDRFRTWAQRSLKRGLPDDDAQRLLWGMALGWRAALTGEVSDPFMKSGTMHIFAISGLHIALIAAILVSLLRVCQVSRAACGVIAIPLIWFYTAATGWQPSAVRSSVMMSVIVGGWALRRPCDLLNSLAAAGLIILVWEPQQLFQASFQLSFFVVLSIALLLPPLEKLRNRWLQTDPLLPPELLPRWRRWLDGPLRWSSRAVATSLAAWLGSLPLTAYYFHLFSPVTLLANLVVVPLASLTLMSCLGSLLCGAWWPAVAELFNHSAWFWMWAMIRISETATNLPGAFFYVKSFSLLDMLLYYTLLVGLLSGWLLAVQRRKWTLPIVCIVAVGIGWLRLAQARTMTLTAIPLNGGSAVFCDTAGKQNDLLVDCGQTNSLAFLTAPFLRAQGVNRLRQLLLTHGDLRQMGGAESVMRDFRVRRVLASGVRQRSATYRRALNGLRQHPNRLQTVQRDEAVGMWRVLHPQTDDRFPQADDNAVVLLGEWRGTRILLLSDLGRSGQEALMEREAELCADVVITGLPARGEPMCDALLERIRPRVVVIVDSEFPAPERAPTRLRERLVRGGAQVICTRDTGAVQLTCGPQGWMLRTMRGDQVQGGQLPALKRD